MTVNTITKQDKQSLGHFQVGSYRYRSLIEGLYDMPYRSLVEALYTLNSPPVVSFHTASGINCHPAAGGSASSNVQ